MRRAVIAGVILGILGSTGSALAQDAALRSIRVTAGLTRPLFVTYAPGDPTRLFIVEQHVNGLGQIRVFDQVGGTLLSQPFLQVPVMTEGEQGLLGLAFHPQYQSNGFFYIHHITPGAGPGGRVVIARYKVSANPNIADAASAQTVIRVEKDQSNHNGGWLGFGPDGYLYFAVGDGGGGNDLPNNAQTITNNLQGKLMRLDVNGDDFPADSTRNYSIPPSNPFVGVTGDDEIWSFGLRNPWRCSFDRATGDLWIADVGQGVWEEVDFQPGGAPGGRNYGWRCMEGPDCRAMAGCNCPTPLGVAPIYYYDHTPGRSITGGYVYRGCAIPDLAGTYIFGDFVSNRIWSLRYNGAQVLAFTERTAELAPGGGLNIGQISSFGEDYHGEVYITDYNGGEVFKIVPVIAGGNCCTADFNGDGFVDGIDYDQFMLAFESGDPGADVNDDGFVDGIDYDTFVNAFEAGC